VPPEQCPECGRFLKRTLVESLADAPEPCPKCGIELTAVMFGSAATAAAPAPAAADGAPAAADGAPAAPGGPAAAVPPPTAAPSGSSVRPPDLPPADVRDQPDPLSGWDVGVPAGRTGTALIDDRRPFPVDTVAVASAAVIGAGLGVLLGRRPVRDGVLVALGGAVGAGVARRIWQLP
jgi:hypothetical protein